MDKNNIDCPLKTQKVGTSVLVASKKRLSYIFDHFENVYFSVSGGKDSGIMVQLANQIAIEKNKKFDLFILDIEANYTMTRHFLEELKTLPAVNKVYHFCLPFYEDNNISIFQPQWIMWNPKEKPKWVQTLPKDAITIDKLDKELLELYHKSHGNPDRFCRYFLKWYYKQNHSLPTACGIGIRTQESLHRYNAIFKGTNKYKNIMWINHYETKTYNFYPIYDWKVEDIWGAVSKYDFSYNQVYEEFYKLGIPLTQMRICQPFGMQQRKGLKQFAAIEPEIWEKVVNRVSGSNFGAMYSKTSLLGYNKTSKPKHLSWEEYAVFMLESLGLYSPGLRDHYYRKISILMNYYEKNFHMGVKDIPQEASRKEWLHDERLWHNWKGIARAIEKNDFALTSRNYSLTKEDEKELYALHSEFQKFLGLEHLHQKIYAKIKK